jgi:hypothetical protein
MRAVRRAGGGVPGSDFNATLILVSRRNLSWPAAILPRHISRRSGRDRFMFTGGSGELGPLRAATLVAVAVCLVALVGIPGAGSGGEQAGQDQRADP